MMKKPKAADPTTTTEAWAEIRSWDGLGAPLEAPRSDWDAKRRARINDETQAEAPLVAELRGLGIPLASVWDLANVRLRYPDAVPVLLAALDKPYPEGVTESILRALAHTYGDPPFSKLVWLARHLPESYTDRLKFALGLAIAANAEKRDLDVLLEVVSDAKLGSGRDEVARRISAWNDPRIVLVLVGFLKTGDSVWAAITALKRARAWSYADAVRPYLTSTNDASREAAEQFMKARQRALGTST